MLWVLISEALLMSTHNTFSWRTKKNINTIRLLMELGFNNTSTLVGHFVLSPRERQKRDSWGDERERHDRKEKMNDSEETEEIKAFPLYPYML